MNSQPRIVVWFSCGAASAVAAYKALEKYGKDRVSVVYCDTFAEEHPDNKRFFMDVENWLGIKIEIIKSKKYENVSDVFMKTRYMAGVAGARCTVEMKKVPRFEYQRPDDIHIFGFTSDEHPRINRFVDNNHDLHLEWILLENNISKNDCYSIISKANIKMPKMYQLGYKNNNCRGCVKAGGVSYWVKIRRDFPAIFKLRCNQSRSLGVRLVKFKGKRIYLDELPPDSKLTSKQLNYKMEDISCGPECGVEANKL